MAEHPGTGWAAGVNVVSLSESEIARWLQIGRASVRRILATHFSEK